VARCVHCDEDVAQLDAANSDLLVTNYSSTCFERLYAHRQEVGLRFTVYGFLSCYSCCDAGKSSSKMCASQDLSWLLLRQIICLEMFIHL
jgi:hypothetical protein